MKPVKDSSKPLKEPASAPSSAKMDGLVNVMWQANTRKGHAYFSFYSRAIEITIEKITTRSNSNKFIQNNLIYEVHNLIYKIYQYEW